MNQRYRSARSSLVRDALIVFCAAAVLTLVMAAPVILHPTTRLFGNEIVGRHHDPFTVMAQWQSSLNPRVQMQVATDWPGMALTRIVGPVAAFNMVILASFPLAALAAWLFTSYLTSSRTAATFAALAFAFSTFHVAHAAYHPHVAQVGWMPLYLLALWMAIDRFTVFRGVMLIGSAALVGLSNFYGALIAAVLTPVVVIARALVGPRGEELARTVVTLTMLALAGAAFVYLLAPGILTGRLDPSWAFPYADLKLYGARWWAYGMPGVEHPTMGTWARSFFTAHGVHEALLEQQLAPGWPILLLALIALGVWLRGAGDRSLFRAIPALLLVAVTAFICSLAPEQRIGMIPLPSPAVAIHSVAPMFRAYARFGLVVSLVTALLAGLGFACLVTSPRRGPRAIAYALALMAFVELCPFPPWRWHDVLPTKAHRWITRLPSSARIFDSAPASAEDVLVPQFTGHAFQFQTDEVIDWYEPNLAGKLAALGFTHVVYRHDTGTRCGVVTDHPPDGFAALATFPDSTVFALGAAPSTVFVHRASGFSDCERSAEGSWRWMADRGEWQIDNLAPEPRTVAVAIELQAFPGERAIAIDVNGHPIQEVLVQPAREWHRIGPLVLQAGANRLQFRPLTSPTVAADVLHNGDPRRLSLAVWTWKWLGPPVRSVKE